MISLTSHALRPARKLACVLLMCGLATAPLGKAGTPSNDPSILGLVERFTAAQAAMDPSTLQALTTGEYVEVSPAGEVDPREKMLGFYGSDAKRAATTVTVDDSTVRVMGASAILIARVTYTTMVEDGLRKAQFRASFIAQRAADGWRLAGAHYTPIRPPRPAEK
jgi:hypothetical protein